MYAAAVDGLDAEARARFDEALAPTPRRVAAPRALRAAPDPRMSEERLAAIRALGGELVEDSA